LAVADPGRTVRGDLARSAIGITARRGCERSRDVMRAKNLQLKRFSAIREANLDDRRDGQVNRRT
jgi:hypothetical protein